MAQENVEAFEDKIYCRLPEGMEGFGGYRPDILVDNLSEREINLFVCKICNGIKRESCFKEHRDRPDYLVNTEEIRQEIGNIKVSCPLKKCEWIGKLSEFEIHINHCVEHEKNLPTMSPLSKVTEKELQFFCFILYILSTGFLCSVTILGIFLYVAHMAQIDILYSEADKLFDLVREHEENINTKMKKLFDIVIEYEENINTDKQRIVDVINNQERVNAAVNSQAIITFNIQHQAQIQRARFDIFEQGLFTIKNSLTMFLKTLEEKSDVNSLLLTTFTKAFSQLHETYQTIRLNPYFPQRGVMWNIYHVNDMFLKPTESSGPEFYVNEYKFQPVIDTLRDNQACFTFCIALVNCNHYDRVKWPMELEDRAFRVYLQTYKNSTETLYFEINEDNKYYFEKPRNEKNKPLCKQWLCKNQLMTYVEEDGLTLYILNSKPTQPDSP